MVDSGRQAEYADIKKIEIEDLKLWGTDKQNFRTKNPIVKVQIDIDPDLPASKQGKDFAKICVYVNQYVWNGFVVFEDASSYVSMTPPMSFAAMLRNTRNHGCDLLVNMHSRKKTPSILFDNTQVFLIKHSTETNLPERCDVVPFAEIDSALKKLNEHYVKLPTNPRKIHYATVEYISDPAIREQFNDPAIVSKFPKSVQTLNIDSFR